MKRTIDILFALAGLIIASPLMAGIAIAITLGDRGPVIFSQTRVGQFGRCFRMHKFRTMVVGAEQRGIPLTVGNDLRITRVGSWIRRTKLDELPQLWNVVKGDMSFVGPRPEVPRYVASYSAHQRRVLEVRPGITDPASLQYFYEANLLANTTDPEATYLETVMPEKIRLNLDYLSRQTVRTDAVVLMNTFRRVVFGAIRDHVPKCERHLNDTSQRGAA